MTIKDLLRKKSFIESPSNPLSPARAAASGNVAPARSEEEPPEFKFYRTTTTDQEEIQPPTYPGDREADQHRRNGHAQTLNTLKEEKTTPEKHRRPSIFKRSASNSSQRSIKEKDKVEPAQTIIESQPLELDPSASPPARPSNQRKVPNASRKDYGDYHALRRVPRQTDYQQTCLKISVQHPTPFQPPQYHTSRNEPTRSTRLRKRRK